MADRPPPPLKQSVSFPKIHLEDDPSDDSTPASPGANPFADPTESLYDPSRPQQQRATESQIEAERLIRRHLHNESPPTPTQRSLARQRTLQRLSGEREPDDQDLDPEAGDYTRRGSLDSDFSLPEEDYLGERPDNMGPGVLSHLLRLYNLEEMDLRDEGDDDLIRASRGDDDDATLRGSRRSSHDGKKKRGGSKDEKEDLLPTLVNPRWYNASRASLTMEAAGEEIGGDVSPGAGGSEAAEEEVAEEGETSEPIERRQSTAPLSPIAEKPTSRAKKAGKLEKVKRGFLKVKRTMKEHKRLRKLEEQVKITHHIAKTLQRQKYILRLCRALIITGAPSHRLEEYLTTTAHVISVPCSFVYLPGCMVISFNDSATHTSDVQLVRAPTVLDLGKLNQLHVVYKEVLHDVIGVEEGIERIEEILKKAPRRNKWYKILLYGGASAAIGPLFDARIRDLPFCFILGSVVAFMALVVNPKSEAFANVFEIVGTIVASFFARAIGSIHRDGKELFCFSGITQGAIAPLLLPGYIILIGALELQSKKLVAGAVRMFYAIIYSVLLWFGISIGTALYGAVDRGATVATKCTDTNLREYRFFYAPLYAFFVALANQAQWIQIPAMLVISTASYTVTYFSLQRFPYTVQISNALASFTVGILGNLYSRLVHQAAFTVMVPAILLQVQSGISSAGSLNSGLKVAQTIVEGNRLKAEGGQMDMGQIFIDGGMAELAYGLVAVAVGISFGLFLSAVVVYPFGKRRSGFFSF